MKTHDFYYELPEELIAQTPLADRSASRLMTLDRTTGAIAHRHFYEIAELLRPGDCLVLNNSRVLPARLLGHRVPTGGAVEVLLLRDKGEGVWECLTKPGRKTHTGTELSFGDGELTALQFLKALKASGKPASQLAGCCAQYPQELINVALSHAPGEKERIMASPVLAQAVKEQEALLGSEGRILIRPSGTEALIRVMVEAKTDEMARKVAEDLSELVKKL
mgnify:CR=1 FL=1